VGLLTKGAIDRAAYYHHAMVLALIPFVSAQYY
jgi:non-canonical (house-cleaning) NTP pyrophosphatase